MNTIFVVDKDAQAAIGDLNDVAKREAGAYLFVPLESIERLFHKLENEAPEVVLLHHHWNGLSISQILERIAKINDNLRVIVYTGQSIVMSELIECVRMGVADYWTERGRLDPISSFRQLSYYCAGSEWTLKKLRAPSGTQKQLIKAAANYESQCKQLSKKNEALEKAVFQGSAGFTQLARWGIKFAFGSILLSAVFLTLSMISSVPVWANLALVSILAVFFLFAEGVLAEVFVKWKNGSARLKGK